MRRNSELQDTLLAWFDREGRHLPWRHSPNPYQVVVSEVMLQQTQVARVVPKYRSWLTVLGDWQALAAASRRQVLQLWSGLGYNNRALRLHSLATMVVEDFAGALPDTEKELRKLPGIGAYTAGAIQVFARNRPGRCVDVNVARIISRLRFPKSRRVTRSQIEEELLASFPDGRAGDWGHALMDLGSALCTATDPYCRVCPVAVWCRCRGERPEEHRQRAQRRQPPFLYSNRWWRGRILHYLSRGPASQQTIAESIKREHGIRDRQRLQAALGQLRQEGLITDGDPLAIREPEGIP